MRAFRDSELISLALGSTSQGNQEKYKTVDGRYYVKARFEYQQRLWRDNLVEVIASMYALRCSLPDMVKVVKQGLCLIGAKEGSYSEAFDRDGSLFVPFSRAAAVRLDTASVHGIARDATQWVPFLINTYSDIVGEDATPYLVSMLLLDLVVANEDRHLGNFGFLCRRGEKQLNYSLLFDFGLGLFEHDGRYYPGMPLERAVKHIRLKPWGLKVSAALDFLETNYSDLVKCMLPKSLSLEDFEFPSDLSRDYFVWINERLGVKIGSV